MVAEVLREDPLTQMKPKYNPLPRQAVLPDYGCTCGYQGPATVRKAKDQVAKPVFSQIVLPANFERKPKAWRGAVLM